jgi:hypothetical protein
MSLQDIEQLVGKIDKAIKIIQNLKAENRKSGENAGILQSRIDALEDENNKLKSEITSKENEISKTNLLHEKLENKIKEILKYLPDDDALENDIIIEKEKKKEKREEEEIIEFVESDNLAVKKSLFSNYKKIDENLSVKDSESSTIENHNEEESDDDFNIIDDINLIEDNGDDEVLDENIAVENKAPEANQSDNSSKHLIEDSKDDIEFYFDTDDSDSELPKGIL